MNETSKQQQPSADPRQTQPGTDDGRRDRSSNTSLFPSTESGNIVVPTAPYPPMNNYHGMQSEPSKSSLSSSPHYTTTYARRSRSSSFLGEQVTIAPESGLLVDGVGTNIWGSTSISSGSNVNNNNNNDDDDNNNNVDSKNIIQKNKNSDGGFPSGSKLYNKKNSGGSSKMNTGGNANNSHAGPIHPSRIMFSPDRHDIVASINCVSSSSKMKARSSRQTIYRRSSSSGSLGSGGKSGDSATMSHANGPIMLELQRLELVTKHQDTASSIDVDADAGGESGFFTTRTVAVSRGNPSLGVTSVASTCMDLPSRSIVQNYGSGSDVVAATGSTTGALCVHRFEAIDEIASESDNVLFASSPIEYFHTPRHHRKASSVAWRPTGNTNHVAIGLVGANAVASGTMSNSNPHLHRRGGTINMRSGGSDREYCCFLWDIADTKQTMPLSKFAYNSPVASLAWMMDGQTLAIGGQQRTIQLYDLRIATNTNNTKLPPLSAHAHEMGIHGIEVHPERPHLMATFCRAIGEPVKLFDIRRMDTAVSEIRLAGSGDHHGASNSTGSLKNAFTKHPARAEAIEWSELEPGMLTVASGDSVQEYDTNSGSRPSLVRMNRVQTAGKCIKAIALYRCQKGATSSNHREPSNDKGSGAEPMTVEETKMGVVDDARTNQQSDRLLSLLYPKRMLVVLEDQTIEDMAKIMKAPLAISHRDGRLVHTLGPHLFMGSSSEGPSAMERIINRNDTERAPEEEDISATMMRRARCLQTNPYSMNPELNIILISQEVAREEIHGQRTQSPTSAMPRYSNRMLLRLWGWIDRVESLSFQDVDDAEDHPRMVTDILSSGALQLLNFQKDEDDAAVGKEQSLYSETFSCFVHDSPARRAALSSCGWAGRFGLSNVMAVCEALGEYERSAALAVWHEDMGAAVEALQRASEAVHQQTRDTETRFSVSSSTNYAETLGLISMCIAGFGGKTESQRGVWTRACASLLKRDDLSSTRAMNDTRVAYLRAVCEFLINTGTAESLLKVLENTTLGLCDRVAFACRFLQKKELTTYLLNCVELCQKQGDLEGLAITGLSKPGIRILQSFVDRYTDVQTAALVVSRVILPTDWAVERKICFEWVESYRSLLNIWQMWQSRAMFDVDRADLLRRVKARSGAGGYQRRIPNPRIRQSPRLPDPDIFPRVPAQLEARCNYCNSPLSLKRQDGTTNQWLSKMQPMLNCCPSCRKPLPRCSICLLSMGSLNPHVELARARQGSRGIIGKNLSSPDDLSSLSSMNFAQWYTWCMRCRHGGHAHHIIGWFSSQKVCPVSGCDCECEFDAAIKLARPATCVVADD